MKQDLQLPFVQSFNHLAHVNMALMLSPWFPAAPGADAVDSVNPLEAAVRLLQGIARNNMAFANELNRNALSIFSGARGGFVALAQAL